MQKGDKYKSYFETVIFNYLFVQTTYVHETIQWLLFHLNYLTFNHYSWLSLYLTHYIMFGKT